MRGSQIARLVTVVAANAVRFIAVVGPDTHDEPSQSKLEGPRHPQSR